MTGYTDRMMRPRFGAAESPRACPACHSPRLASQGGTSTFSSFTLRNRLCLDCGAHVKTTEPAFPTAGHAATFAG